MSHLIAMEIINSRPLSHGLVTEIFLFEVCTSRIRYTQALRYLACGCIYMHSSLFHAWLVALTLQSCMSDHVKSLG